MLKKWQQWWKKKVYKILPFLIATIGQAIVWAILRTCRWKIEGLERFKEIANKEKCILMLWHNRLAMAPSILYRFAPEFIYAAFVSNSRDGELISAVVHSYKAGRTIRVSHQARHQALLELIRHVEDKQEIVIITPDGPRGPRYQIKPGIALAAIETTAHVVPLNWEASRFWQLGTWDRLRLPKPFSTIRITFAESIVIDKKSGINIQQAQEYLQKAMRFSGD